MECEPSDPSVTSMLSLELDVNAMLTFTSGGSKIEVRQRCPIIVRIWISSTCAVKLLRHPFLTTSRSPSQMVQDSPRKCLLLVSKLHPSVLVLLLLFATTASSARQTSIHYMLVQASSHFHVIKLSQPWRQATTAWIARYLATLPNNVHLSTNTKCARDLTTPCYLWNQQWFFCNYNSNSDF